MTDNHEVAEHDEIGVFMREIHASECSELGRDQITIQAQRDIFLPSTLARNRNTSIGLISYEFRSQF